MTKKRDTVAYYLKDGHKVVYYGTTKDLTRRERQHRNEGKQFTEIAPTSRLMTPEGAKQREAELLVAYRRSHRGNNPQYNKDRNG